MSDLIEQNAPNEASDLKQKTDRGYLTESDGKPSSSRLKSAIAVSIAFSLILLEASVRAYLAFDGAEIPKGDIVAEFDTLCLLLGYSGVSWLQKPFSNQK